MTLEQIARDAEVGIGTLYRHFPTREALVEALYRKELADLCAAAGDLVEAQAPERALRAWMDLFADYVAAKREMADTLRAVFASGAVTVSQAREELTVAVTTIVDAGVANGTLRDDVRPEDVVAMIIGDRSPPRRWPMDGSSVSACSTWSSMPSGAQPGSLDACR